MAPVPLNISPAFRPWRQAGITHLLLDDEVRERLLARPEPEPSEAAPPVRQHSAPPQRGERRQPQPPSYTPPPQPQPVSSAPQKPVRIADTDTLAPDVWPAYWQTLLKKTPPRPSLVWSYPSLSRDLGGDADAAHRDFLRRLLGDMALPKGSHAFWPLNRYPYGDGESEQTVDARMFLSGIAALKPESVILMCGQVPPRAWACRAAPAFAEHRARAPLCGHAARRRPHRGAATLCPAYHLLEVHHCRKIEAFRGRRGNISESVSFFEKFSVLSQWNCLFAGKVSEALPSRGKRIRHLFPRINHPKRSTCTFSSPARPGSSDSTFPNA